MLDPKVNKKRRKLLVEMSGPRKIQNPNPEEEAVRKLEMELPPIYRELTTAVQEKIMKRDTGLIQKPQNKFEEVPEPVEQELEPRYRWPTISSKLHRRQIFVPVNYKRKAAKRVTTTYGMSKEQKAEWLTHIYGNGSPEKVLETAAKRGVKDKTRMLQYCKICYNNKILAERILEAKPKVSTYQKSAWTST